MSHSSHANVPPSTSGVEEDFIDFKGVYGFGIGLAVVTIIAHILMLWMFKAEVAAVDASNPPRVYPLACCRLTGHFPIGPPRVGVDIGKARRDPSNRKMGRRHNEQGVSLCDIPRALREIVTFAQ